MKWHSRNESLDSSCTCLRLSSKEFKCAILFCGMLCVLMSYDKSPRHVISRLLSKKSKRAKTKTKQKHESKQIMFV